MPEETITIVVDSTCMACGQPYSESVTVPKGTTTVDVNHSNCPASQSAQ